MKVTQLDKEIIEKLIANKRDDLYEFREGEHNGEVPAKVIGMIPYLKTKKIIVEMLESKNCNSCKYSPNEERNTYSTECCGCSNFFSNKWEAKDA